MIRSSRNAGGESSGRGLQRRVQPATTGAVCQLLPPRSPRPRLPETPERIRVWSVVCVRNTGVVAVLDRSFIGRVAAAAEGEQRGGQERNQQPHSEAVSLPICIPSFQHFAVAPHIDAPGGVRMPGPLSKTLQQ